MSNPLPHVVVVGAGFGGLRAAQALLKQEVRVTLIDRRNYHLFQPLLYQVATAELSPADIAYPVRKIFRNQPRFDFCLTEVKAVDLPQKQLITTAGTIAYDYLVLAAGGQTNHFGIESVAKYSFGMKNIEDSLAVRNHLLQLFEYAAGQADPAVRQAMLTFVVAGGGPTGVETAGAIHELAAVLAASDYPGIRPGDFRVILLEATDKLLPGLPDSLSQYTRRTLENMRVEVRLGAFVTDFNGKEVSLKGQSTIPAYTLIWAAGIRAADLIKELDSKKAGLNRAVVGPTLQLPDYPEVFVIGDAAYCLQDGRPLPMIAPVAMQQADTVAENINRLLAGRELKSLFYKSPGSMAIIGRAKAVAVMGSMQFSGFPAWLMWLAVHVIRLTGFRNRCIVLINWVWDIFFADKGVRSIMPAPVKPAECMRDNQSGH